MPEKKITLADLLIRRLGIANGFRAMTYVQLWGTYMFAVGHPPASIEQLAEEAGVTARTLYRYQDHFRKATGQDNPTAVMEAAMKAYGERQALRRSVVAGMPVPWA